MTKPDNPPADACFACGRPLRGRNGAYLVDTRDAQTAYVGADCFKKIRSMGDEGWQPPLGGPRLYLLAERTKPNG